MAQSRPQPRQTPRLRPRSRPRPRRERGQGRHCQWVGRRHCNLEKGGEKGVDWTGVEGEANRKGQIVSCSVDVNHRGCPQFGHASIHFDPQLASCLPQLLLMPAPYKFLHHVNFVRVRIICCVEWEVAILRICGNFFAQSKEPHQTHATCSFTWRCCFVNRLVHSQSTLSALCALFKIRSLAHYAVVVRGEP